MVEVSKLEDYRNTIEEVEILCRRLSTEHDDDARFPKMEAEARRLSKKIRDVVFDYVFSPDTTPTKLEVTKE